MKYSEVVVLICIAAICAVEGVPRARKLKDINVDTPATSQTVKTIPKNENIIEELELIEQSSTALPKLSPRMKPLMRKFIPKAKPSTEMPVISRRPLMKHREFFITPASPKPQLNKTELFSAAKRRLLNPIFAKSISKTTKRAIDDDDADDYDKFASNDKMMAAGSRKVYRKIMGRLPKKFLAKHRKTVYKISNAENVNLVDRKDGENRNNNNETMAISKTFENSKPLFDSVSNNNEIKTHDDDEEADKDEFIFIQSSVVPPSDLMEIIITTIDSSLQNLDQSVLQSTPVVTPKLDKVNKENSRIDSTSQSSDQTEI